MKPLHMSARRWFWALVLSAVLLLLVNEKFLDPSNVQAGSNREARASASIPAQMQGWVRDNVVGFVLLPATATFSWTQNRLERLGGNAGGNNLDGLAGNGPGGAGGKTVADAKLLEENLLLNNQILILMKRVEDLENALKNINQLQSFPSLANRRPIRSNVVSYNPGPYSLTVGIDRGSADGILPRAIVVSQQLSLIGRVVSVGSRTATVRLITDPARPMWVTANLMRPNGAMGYTPIATGQVHGTGNGMLRCETIDASQGIPPEKGDIVQIDDNDWAIVKGMKLGIVESVSHLESHALRWDVIIRPAVTPNQDTTVFVINP